MKIKVLSEHNISIVDKVTKKIEFTFKDGYCILDSEEHAERFMNAIRNKYRYEIVEEDGNIMRVKDTPEAPESSVSDDKDKVMVTPGVEVKVAPKKKKATKKKDTKVKKKK
jgi:hypothetical protein